jgi:uncharacterized membrane protein YphA (DoxX/SURF4 family)
MRLLKTCHHILISHPLRLMALTFLCLPYIVSGVHKIMDHGAGLAEMSSYGLLPPAPYSAATAFIQIACSAMIITGFLRWFGALVLAIFTIIASMIAEPFWRPGGADVFAMLQTFCEHLGLVGGLLLVTWYNLHKYKNHGKDDWQ